MAHVLAYTSPARGHLFPLVPILDELRRRGHRVAVRTLASQVPLMLARGFDAAAVSNRVEAVAHEDWRGRNPRQALAIAVRVMCTRAAHDAADLHRAIDIERPDAVLVDINSWGALAAAERWGGPWAAFCPYPLALRSRDAPPFGPGLQPARGLLGHARDRLLRPLVTGTIEKTMLPALNSVRVAMGTPLLDHADDLFRRPHLLLYLTAEPFEYPRSDWPDNLVMVGPCAWEPAADPPPWLSTVDQPIVLVTTSSEYQNDNRLVTVAVQALAEEPVHVVATQPSSQGAIHAVAGNAHVEGFLPHGPVLDRAVCAVTHGGMGATQKALARGIPVCVVPFGRDQLEVARRVQVAGAGTRLPASRLRPDRLRTKVREAMTRTEGARRVATGFAAAGGATTAADAVENRLLSARPVRARPRSAAAEPTEAPTPCQTQPSSASPPTAGTSRSSNEAQRRVGDWS